tara:strand:- start:8691 stop:10505 length:1815 start_codon:yes stop_codon:yes gene_type:complete
MIIELSKDKSLRNVLLKANIDNDTMSLVKADAHISAIKNSLIENLNSSNMVQYRKYIAKAEDEEDELRSDEEIRDDLEEELDESMATTVTGGGGTGISQTKDLEVDEESKVVSEVFQDKENRRRKFEHKRIIRELKDISKLLDATKVLANNIKVKKSRRTLSGYKFLNFASWVGRRGNEDDSNKLLAILTILKKETSDEKNFFYDRYKEFLTADGKLEVLETKNKKGKITRSKSVNIKKIVTQLKELNERMLPIEDSNEKISLYDALVNLHINEIEKNPAIKQNKGKFARQTARSKEIARKLSMPDQDIAMEMKKTIESIQKEYDKLGEDKEKIEEYIRIFESLLEGGTDSIIANKIERLTKNIKALYEEKTRFRDIPETETETGRRVTETVLRPKKGEEGKISELTELINQIREGKTDILEEATEDVQRDLQKEQAKLERVEESIERMNQFRGELGEYIEIFERFPNPPEVPKGIKEGEEREEQERQLELKEQWDRRVKNLISLGETIESIHYKLKKVSKLISKVSDFEAEEFKEWVQGEAGRRPVINETDSEWLQMIAENRDVIDTYDNRDIGQLEKLSLKLSRDYENIDRLKSQLRDFIGD